MLHGILVKICDVILQERRENEKTIEQFCAKSKRYDNLLWEKKNSIFAFACVHNIYLYIYIALPLMIHHDCVNIRIFCWNQFRNID